MTINERRNVHRMAQFIGLFYAKQFLRSRIAIFSPTDDFQFYGSMLSYKEEDSDIAMAVLNSIEWFAVGILDRLLLSLVQPQTKKHWLVLDLVPANCHFTDYF